MSKNVIIAEGGNGKRMNNVGKILTDRQDGGVDVWVPADDRLTRQKFISKNGTYYASSDEVYGYSKLTVNVAGGAQGQTVPTVTTDPYNVEIPDVSVEPTDMPVVPGSIGSSVVGIDPDTGNLSIVTVKPNGTVEIKPIPAAIRVKVPPNKLSYVKDQYINYQGLVIELLKTDGTVFKSDDYPDGTIAWTEGPFQKISAEHPYRNYEIITTVERAENGNEGSSTKYPGVHFVEIEEMEFYYCDGPYHFSYADYYNHVSFRIPRGRVCLVEVTGMGENKAYIEFATPEENGQPELLSYYRTLISPDGPEISWDVAPPEWNTQIQTIEGKGYVHSFLWEPANADVMPQWPLSEEINHRGHKDWLEAMYGEGAQITGTKIPVKWLSPYNSSTLETSFDINVSESYGNDVPAGGGGGSHHF